MFNRTYITKAPAYPQYVSVTEKRAPTDESVKILREAEDRAQKAIVESTHVDNCPIDAVLHKQFDVLSDSTKYACIFKINGKKHRVDYEHRPKGCLSANEDKLSVAMGVRDAIAQEIANVLMEPLCKHFNGRNL